MFVTFGDVCIFTALFTSGRFLFRVCWRACTVRYRYHAELNQSHIMLGNGGKYGRCRFAVSARVAVPQWVFATSASSIPTVGNHNLFVFCRHIAAISCTVFFRSEACIVYVLVSIHHGSTGSAKYTDIRCNCREQLSASRTSQSRLGHGHRLVRGRPARHWFSTYNPFTTSRSNMLKSRFLYRYIASHSRMHSLCLFPVNAAPAAAPGTARPRRMAVYRPFTHSASSLPTAVPSISTIRVSPFSTLCLPPNEDAPSPSTNSQFRMRTASDASGIMQKRPN